MKNLEGAVICLINTEGREGPKHTFAHIHVYTDVHRGKPYVSVQYQSPSPPPSQALSLSPTRCFRIPPSRPIGGSNFSPENKHGTLIKVLISDPAAFRNITLSLCTVTVVVMI